MPKVCQLPEGFQAGRRAKRDTEYFGHAIRYLETLQVKGKRVLDLGASTGDFAYLALDQGAKHVTTVEDEDEYWSIITHNLSLRFPAHKWTLLKGAVTSQEQQFTQKQKGHIFDFAEILRSSRC